MLTLEPIGIIRTPYTRFYDTPRQPAVDQLVDDSIVELLPGRNYEQAVHDLEGCDRIWLVVFFHLAGTWKPKVLPPRGRTKRGVFATRSPHRPNPIGLTCCELLEVRGRTLRVRGTDLIDQTPVLDIKPYLAYADAFPEARVSWIDDLSTGEFDVPVDALADLPTDVCEHVVRILRTDPFPHPYRRIEQKAHGVYQISVREYRIEYLIDDSCIRILGSHVVL
jgi:tRNA-Thr(GGU) m(6)t(6)A37 methyltransferase TsaA